jgi:histidine triad (HIT) family protein
VVRGQWSLVRCLCGSSHRQPFAILIDYNDRNEGQRTTDHGPRAKTMIDNIFLKIIEKKIPAQIVYEDDQCLAFRDINPQAPVHVLIIPKKVIATHDAIGEADADLLGHMHVVSADIARELGLADGYRLVMNCRESAGQTVPHLHLHLLGGRDFTWPPG